MCHILCIHSAVLSKFDEIQVSRKLLPIYALRDDLLAAIDQYQILVIVGETGT